MSPFFDFLDARLAFSGLLRAYCAPMTQDTNKRLFIRTWGCQMNVYDSDRMAQVLAPMGFQSVDTPEGADMIILNTCHIREKATEKVFSELGRLRAHKDAQAAQGKRTILAVAGCVAQAEGDLIMARAPYVDMVFGPQTYHELPEMIVRATGARVINTSFAPEAKFDTLPEITSGDAQGLSGVRGGAAFLSIQEGCDKFCTFCVVPYTRGAEFSRPEHDILEEAKRLRDAGAVEITLLGQNVNAWHGTRPDGMRSCLAELIGRVAEIEGISRIRYTTSHPRDMSNDLIAAHGEIPALMPFLHLPVQSGSDKILKAMNRKHGADLFREHVSALRKARPDIALSSDFIVGFPGETEADFEDTLDLVRETRFYCAYSFKYSPRPGTPAAIMQSLVAEPVKTERLARLQDILNTQQKAFNLATRGRTLPVLFDRTGHQDGQLLGRTPYNQPCHAKAHPRLLGTIVDVHVRTATLSSLGGDIVLVDAQDRHKMAATG